MYNLPILSFITFIPLIGAMILMAVSYFSKNEAAKKQLAANSPYVALIVSVVVFLLSLLLVLNFDRTTADFQFVENMSWLGGGINYRLGVDGISVLFILLTAFLTPLCIIASQASIKDRMLEYMVAFLILETLMIGVFGVWGGKNRVYASYKFFLYTLLGSVLMLAAIIWIYIYSGQQLGEPTMDISVLINELKIPGGVQTWLWLAFFASFAVKMPMWPLLTTALPRGFG